MKALVVLLFAVAYVECRKTYVPINKNANVDFINMEGGGGVRPGSAPKPASPPASPPGNAPVPVKPVPATVKPPTPVLPPVTAKPAVAVTPPVATPKPTPIQITPLPVNPKPVATPISTPGPGSVKQLVNFYDSQGKASPIRPYSYSQAVKQG